MERKDMYYGGLGLNNWLINSARKSLQSLPLLGLRGLLVLDCKVTKISGNTQGKEQVISINNNVFLLILLEIKKIMLTLQKIKLYYEKNTPFHLSFSFTCIILSDSNTDGEDRWSLQSSM